MSYLKMALEAMKAAEERGSFPRTQTLGPVSKHNPEDKVTLTSPPERILTCYECNYFRPAVSSPNPRHAWGHCNKRNKGQYGVAMACEWVLSGGGERA
jgi:hypothetical protein